jgi:hypothetical protein
LTSGAPRRLLPGLLALLVAMAVALVVACGGGGGGGGGPTEPTPPPPPPPPPPGIVFTAQGTPGANTLFLASGAATTSTTLVLELRASQVTNLYGVAFDLTYPNTQLQFVRVTPGPLLSGGAAQAAAAGTGTLIVGGTRLGNVPGATGSGVVLTLEFTAVAAGTGSFAFARNSALNSEGDAVTGVAWLAGSVQVNR